jgi:methionyl aminopeptidase
MLQLCGPGVPVSAIGAVCADVAQKHKLTVVRDFIGHGVGTVFHAAPQVLHHRNNEPDKMQVRQTPSSAAGGVTSC